MIKKWTIWIGILLLLAAALDVASTWFASPDLSNEANPLVIAFGRTWVSVFGIKVIGSLICIFVFNYSLHALSSRRERLSGLDGFWRVMGHLVYKRELSLSEFLVRGEIRDLGAYLSLIGLSVTIGIVLGSVTASILNSFRLIHSYEAAIVFLCATGAFGTALGALMAYRFLKANIEAEQDVADQPAAAVESSSE